MKKIISIILTAFMCLSLCSCDTILNKAKSVVTGAEISKPPEDYLATLSNEQFEYELYKGYIKVIKYLAEDTVVEIPSEIDNTPVEVIGELCFYGIETKVTNVIIPDSVKTIETKAFYLATSLVEIEIPDTVVNIGENAFAWCAALTSVKIGKGVTVIPDYCFNSCPLLTTVEIPDNVTKIGLRAFSYCNVLTEITLHESISEVGSRAFAGCPILEYINIKNPQLLLGDSVFDGSDKAVIVAEESSSAYIYCTTNYTLWTPDKSIEPMYLFTPEDDTTSSVSDEVSESET